MNGAEGKEHRGGETGIRLNEGGLHDYQKEPTSRSEDTFDSVPVALHEVESPSRARKMEQEQHGTFQEHAHVARSVSRVEFDKELYRTRAQTSRPRAWVNTQAFTELGIPFLEEVLCPFAV